MKDVKHIVVQMNPSGNGSDTPEDTENILREYLKKGFVIFYAAVINNTPTTITWAYLLTKE